MRVPQDNDISQQLAEAVQAVSAARTRLAICGNGTKRFYAGDIEGERLDVTGHRGIVSYEPTELVVTARAGTPLAEIEAALAERDQMLGFEPPHFGAHATLGGTVACGLSGPRRPYAGGARDFVLGVRILNGRGESLAFGGQVMKNVAGYDVSRLMVGAFGTLGVLLEVSLKVLPRPAREITLAFEAGPAEALARMNAWAGQPLPLSAACCTGGVLYARFSGSETAIKAARARLGGAVVEEAAGFWEALREHEHPFFAGDVPLWRLSVPPATPPMELLPGEWLYDWGGAQRWLRSEAPPRTLLRAAAEAGGHARLFRGRTRIAETLHALEPGLRRLHDRLKQAFDPAGILNVGRVLAVC